MGDVTSVYIRGESGTVRKFDLPLPWPIEDKLTKGQIHEVSDPDDASSVVAPEDSPVVAEREGREAARVVSSEPKPESPTEVPGRRDEEPGTDEHTPAVEEPVKRPAANAPKADWVTFARSVDPDLSEDDAQGMTKTELQNY